MTSANPAAHSFDTRIHKRGMIFSMTKHYIKGYPRPQFVRPDWELLNGEWDFAFDDEDKGLEKGWAGGFGDMRKITVPFSYESPASGIGDETAHQIVWYCRRLTLSPKQGQQLLLHFEGCDYSTGVWLNGSYLGQHDGGYTRFSYDLTPAAQEGENILVVRVKDSFSTTQPRGKQRWKPENFGCWYVQTTGIWKSVWLERVPSAHIQSVKITPLFDEERVQMEFKLANCRQSAELEAIISFGDTQVNRVRQSVNGITLRQTYDLRTAAMDWKVAAWSQAAPNLYDVTFNLYVDGVLTDTAYSYFGLRKIACENGRLRLNNNPLYLRMVLDQGYWPDSHLTPPSEEALIEDIQKTLEMGFNGSRKHQKVEDERWLYWCDVLGLLVWHEMPSAYEYDDEAASAFLREWTAAVRQHYNHPCIITWVPVNESWGVPNIYGDKRQQQFTEAVYAVTKTYDLFRPVIVNDGWEHTVSDIVTLHDYDCSGESMMARYGKDLGAILRNEISHNNYRYAFASGYGYHGQPVIISEYGGVAIEGGEGWGYNGKVKDEAACADRIESLTDAIKSMDIVCGYCYTQLTDVQQEVNGLLYADRTPKVSLDKISHINLK